MTVYFISDGEHIKIGYTEQSVSSRLATLQTGNPKRLVVLCEISGGREFELQLHQKFKALHVRGEWFERKDELLEYIRNKNRDAVFTAIDTSHSRYPDKPKELFTIVFRKGDSEVYVAADYYPDGFVGALYDGIGFCMIHNYPYIPLSVVESKRGMRFDKPRELYESALIEVQDIY